MSNKENWVFKAGGGLVLATCLLSGCASRGGILGVDRCADIPAGAVPRPAGEKVCAWQKAQVANAVADQTVFYQGDFIEKTDAISPAAIERMARNASNGLAAGQASIIESSGDQTLDTARVNSVRLQWASLGIEPPMVEIATPAALGMDGTIAETVARNNANPGGGSNRIGAPTVQPLGFGDQAGGLGRGVVGGGF